MKKQLVYLIGKPGAGKTTLMNAVFSKVGWIQNRLPVAHVVYPGGIEIGVRRKLFAGTDGLSMNIQEHALRFIRDCQYDAIVAEGDRLGNARFFNAVRQWVDLTVYLLDTPDEVAAERRRARGSNQSESWVKGRVTKVNGLSGYVTYRLNGLNFDEALRDFGGDPTITRILEKRIVTP